MAFVLAFVLVLLSACADEPEEEIVPIRPTPSSFPTITPIATEDLGAVLTEGIIGNVVGLDRRDVRGVEVDGERVVIETLLDDRQFDLGDRICITASLLPLQASPARIVVLTRTDQELANCRYLTSGDETATTGQ